MHNLVYGNPVDCMVRTCKLGVQKVVSYTRVIFTSFRLGTNKGFVQSLYVQGAQACAQDFWTFNTSKFLFVPAFHRTNKSYNKGD